MQIQSDVSQKLKEAQLSDMRKDHDELKQKFYEVKLQMLIYCICII